MDNMFSRVVDIVSALMAGGTMEIILLIVLIIVALIVLLVAIWLAWKLLVLLGKGIAWLARTGNEKYKERSAASREERLAAPPLVAVGWSSSTRLGLRRAMLEARRLAGPDALRIVVVAGSGIGNLFRGLGLTPPGVGRIGIGASPDTVLIDASSADSSTLRKLGRALPWRRPLDGVAAVVDDGGIPSEALARTAGFARSLGLRTALHFVFPSSGATAGWRVIDAQNRNGDAICSQLAADATRAWLTEGDREGLTELALAQNRELPTALDRALAVSPSAVDIASLSLGAAGLRGAVAQTTERTRPDTAPSLVAWAGVAILGIGLLLTTLAVVTALDRSAELRAAVSSAEREASVAWSAENIDSIPSAGRVRRVAGLSVRLAEESAFSAGMPAAWLVPNSSAAQRLGEQFLVAYVLAPLATALDNEARRNLQPDDDPTRWIESARVVSEWLVAWEGLEDDPEEVDIRRLFVAAFGGDQSAWAEGTDTALIATGAKPPPPALGGLDVDGLTTRARDNFVVTMQRWADRVYTNGPVATAARRAIDRSANWREQHAALVELRAALQDPSQQWLTAARDEPDYAYELRILGRALALPLLGQENALMAKAAVAKVRIDAREAAEYFILPEIGPLMVRSSSGGQGSGGGPSLTMTPEAEAWLSFLDRVAKAGFANLPKDTGTPPIGGPVSMDAVAVSEVRSRLRVFDQFASNLPANLPPAVAGNLVRELSSELVVGTAVGVEQALRPVYQVGMPTEQAQRLVRSASSLADLREVESWLRERTAESEADRVLAARGRVAETLLAASAEALAQEDPLGIHLDPSADGNALVRRMDRGIARLRTMHEQLAAPFVEPGVSQGWATVNWRHIGEELDAFQRGNTDAALSGLEGMVRALSDDFAAACDAPRAAVAAGRDDYVVIALSRFRTQMDNACNRLDLERAQRRFEQVADYFQQHIAWLWPYSTDANAPELPTSTVNALVQRLHDVRDDLKLLSDPFAHTLGESAAFWSRDDDGNACVQFRVFWRARPSDEHLAENIINVDLNGTTLDEDGVQTWRYGSPVALRVRLASNSAYRFVDAVDPEEREVVLSESGNGALLRLFSRLAGGAMTFELPVLDGEENTHIMRVTARITNADGASLTMPHFPDSLVSSN